MNYTTENLPSFEVTLIGENGNAFSLMGIFFREAKKAGWPKDAIEQVRAEAMSGDYDNLLQTLMKYAEVN